MAVQFFFKDPETDNMGEVLSSGYKAGLEMRAGQIKKDLDATYNQHVVTEPQYDATGNVTARPGDLDHAGFIKSAQAAGLPMQESMQYLAHQKAQRDAMLDQAQSENMIRASGYNPSPSVTGRAGAPIGNPATPEEAYLKTADKLDKSSLEDWFSNPKANTTQAQVAPTAEEIAANDKLVAGLRSPSEVAQTSQGGISYADVARTLGIGGNASTPQVSADGSTMDLGQGVINGVGPVEKPVEEAKMTEPAPWDGIYTPAPRTPDTRTMGQAVQDTYNPEATGVSAGGAVKGVDIFDYSKVTNVGDVKIKQGIDSALAKLGQDQSQAGVDRLMAIAAQSVPVPVMSGKSPEAYSKWIEARQAYPAKVLEAQKKVASDLASGNSGAIAEQMGREQLGLSKDQFKLAVDQNARAESQVSHPAINGFLPSPTEKVALTDASGAVREIADQMSHVPSPSSAEWPAFQTILAKSVVKSMSLPVGEGLLDDVAAKVQNGMSASDAINALKNGGVGAGAANAAAQVLSTTMGLNTIAGANRLAQGATEFARKKWSAYGEGKEFNKFFPEYKATGAKDSPAPSAPKPPAEAKKPEKATKSTAKIGSITNPYPAGSTPPVGSYYIHPRTGNVMKRTK